jgi:tyrosinase
MRFSVVLLAVTAATASVIQERAGVNLPASAFAPHRAHMISYEDAVSGADLVNKTSSDNGRVSSLMFSAAASNVQSSAAATCSQNPGIRFEWRQYSQSDRVAFMQAIQCLIKKPSGGSQYAPSTNRFEDFARVHQRFTPNIHGNPKFLIWHRYFLWTFEQTLRRECGFNRAMVWWDETKDAGAFAKSDMFSNSYFGNLPAANNGQPVCITSGAFAGMTAHIGPGSGSGAHCLSRAVDESLTAQCNTNFVNQCNSRTSYADMESCAEGGYISLSSLINLMSSR